MDEIQKLNEQYSKILASFSKRFFSAFFDISLSLIINIPVLFLIIYLKNRSFSNPLNAQQINITIKFWFSFYLFIFFFFIFAIAPKRLKYQTLFSKVFKIKAISLKNEQITTKEFFKVYFVPVFFGLIVNLIIHFLYLVNNKNTHETFYTASSSTKIQEFCFFLMRGLGTIYIFISLNYLFVVFLSKKKINWFSIHMQIIYIDLKKEKNFSCSAPKYFEKNAFFKSESEEKKEVVVK